MIRRISLPLGLVACVLSTPCAARGQDGAVIEGTLVAGPGPARKTASRYPAGITAPREMQPVPAVVYLAGEGLAARPADRAERVVDVMQRDTAFMPSAITIRTGTVVRFPNGDPFFHNVFSYARNARFDLCRYPEGESREVAFDEPGIARVFCEVHEFMRAVVLVTDHSFHAVVADDGSFRLEGVPPGEHTLVWYHPDVGSVERTVVVGRGERVRVVLDLGADRSPTR
jgi:plastocyanin